MASYVAAYDVQNPGQRRRVAAVLKDYGQRVQRSVFEIWVEPAELPDLRRRIGAILNKTDCFDLYPVDVGDLRRRISWQRPPTLWQAVVLA
jgi:CRISPR-associated protein Cas2